MAAVSFHLNGIPLSLRSVALLNRCGMKPWNWTDFGDGLRYVAFSRSEWDKMVGGAGSGLQRSIPRRHHIEVDDHLK